jgi:hypothetical protein
MPIYEFYCADNRKIYRFFARSLSLAEKTPRCPDNPKYKMERLLSQFAFIGRAKEPAENPQGEMDDPRMEAAMAEMEREFSGMSDENPDPKALARMMRKMSSLTGEAFPEAVGEMIARMEKGEDPEKLEEEYGEALGALDEPGGTPDSAELGKPGNLQATLRRLRQPRITRDPTLYEMRDFVE